MAATHFIRSLRPATRNSFKAFPTLQSQSRVFGASALRATERFPSSPPDFPSIVNPNHKRAGPYTGKLEHLTGGRETAGAQKPELEVGEMEGITFKVEPLKRQGEDTSTMRARLLCMSGHR